MFEPKYTISNQILNHLSEIAEIKSLIKKSKLLPKREIFLKKTAIVKMAHTSTSIEGNTLKEYQVAQIIEGKKIDEGEKQILEVKNYLKALKKIDSLSLKKIDITKKDILNLHQVVVNKLVNRKDAGNFRETPVYVVNIDKTKEKIIYTPPKAENIDKLIADLVSWLNSKDEIHPIIKAAFFHYQFETIHPFIDGNGRCGRLLTLLYLYQSGWDFKKILVLEDYYNSNRKAYYQALQTGKTYNQRQSSDLTDWIEYFVKGFLHEAIRVKEKVLSLTSIGKISDSLGTLSKNELEVLDFVVTVGKITSSDVVDIIGCPKRTAQDKLKKLSDKKILKKIGAGPSTFYELNK